MAPNQLKFCVNQSMRNAKKVQLPSLEEMKEMSVSIEACEGSEFIHTVLVLALFASSFKSVSKDLLQKDISLR